MKVTYLTEERKLASLSDLTLSDPEMRNREPKIFTQKKRNE